MNSELYEKWIKSHQNIAGDVDITDAVMKQITPKPCESNILERTWETILLDLLQTRVLTKSCVLVSGALMGLLRIFIQMYSVLFT